MYMLSFPSISHWLKDKAHPKVLSLEGDVLLELGLPELVGMDIQPPVQMNPLAALFHPSNPTHTTDHPLPQLLDLSPKQSPAVESQGLQHPLQWASLPSSMNIPPTEVSIALSQDSSTLVDDRLWATSTMIVLLMIYEMVIRIGWPVMSPGKTAQRQWKSMIHEILLQASVIIPGELAGKASPYAKMFFVNNDMRLFMDEAIIQWKNNICTCITDGSAFTSFFMHEHKTDGKIVHWYGNQHLKDFHINFWYTTELNPMKVAAAKDINTTPLWMYALTAVAALSIHPYMKCTTTLFPKQLRTPLSAWQLITICCGFINAHWRK
ncbi:hypothetical protein F5J12DRAFT_787322 [Pisolithus orientalis]|uniref:uncharacterized protein n=1 Tax=Pisolithus orientalis TaxID=936130 RepID=UPI0022258913|nr:uncharacterized protein F5J12DRAFT_787322 [Pisolithus orientalis]KAI5985925.1 hypothetical protein F5J12DRAFT_787322 [Pisolithus orientalis]